MVVSVGCFWFRTVEEEKFDIKYVLGEVIIGVIRLWKGKYYFGKLFEGLYIYTRG